MTNKYHRFDFEIYRFYKQIYIIFHFLKYSKTLEFVVGNDIRANRSC